MLGKHGGRAVGQPGRQHRLPAPGAVDRRNRHPPRPLARDTPVRPVGQHVVDPLFPPRGEPLHLRNRSERPVPQVVGVHLDEPLPGGQEDHRVMTPPAVRVSVVERLAVPQPACLGQRHLHLRVGVEDLLAPDNLDVVVEPSRRPDRGIDLQPVAHAGRVVVGAVPRRRVYRAGPLFQCHVVGQHAHRVPVIKRVPEPQPLQGAPLQADERGAEVASDRPGDLFGQPLGDDDRRAVDVVEAVVDLGVERHSEVRGDRPGRGRPDEHRHRPVPQRGCPLRQRLCALGAQRKLDVDRRRGVVFVVHLRLGERGTAVRTPVHRLLALVDHSLLDEPAEGPHDGGLVVGRHRQIRSVPGAEDTEPLEAGRLQPDELLRVPPAGAAEVGHAHLALLPAELSLHLQLDRQPVTVPARHIRRIEPRHRPRLDDDVLQHLVQHVPDVDRPIGVGRAVVQDELRRAGALRADTRVEPHFVPARDGGRLRCLEIGSHRKAGPRQIEGLLPVRHRRSRRRTRISHCSAWHRPAQAAGTRAARLYNEGRVLGGSHP